MKKMIILVTVIIVLTTGYFLPIEQVKTPIDKVLSKVVGMSDKTNKEDSCPIQITGTLEEKPPCLGKN